MFQQRRKTGMRGVASVAVDLAKSIYSDLSGHEVLLLGAGEIAESAARALKAAGATKLLIANRSYEKAEALAAQIEGAAARSLGLDFSRFTEAFSEGLPRSTRFFGSGRFLLCEFSTKEFERTGKAAFCLSRVGSTGRGEINESAGSNSIAVRREVELDSMTISDATLFEVPAVTDLELDDLELDCNGAGEV